MNDNQKQKIKEMLIYLEKHNPVPNDELTFVLSPKKKLAFVYGSDGWLAKIEHLIIYGQTK